MFFLKKCALTPHSPVSEWPLVFNTAEETQDILLVKVHMVLREWDENMPVQNCWLREKEDE